MQITFLVGNGFDISIGIDSSYRCFYQWYFKQPSENNYIAAFKEEIKKDIENGGENWSDFEIGLGKYTENFTLETADQFIECYEDARESIIKYLSIERTKVNVDKLSEGEIEKLKQGFTKFYQDLNPRERRYFDKYSMPGLTENIVYNIISFNYTDALDKCVQQLGNKALATWTSNNIVRTARINSNVIHVHGTTEFYPIFGVNDVTQLSNQSLLENRHIHRLMLKPDSVEFLGEFWHEDAEKIIDDSTIICIWGMSLGESDYRWWNKIYSWLKVKSNHCLILFWYTDKKIDNLSIYKRDLAIDAALDKFYSVLGLSQKERDEIASKIFVVLNTQNVLSINLTSNLEDVEK